MEVLQAAVDGIGGAPASAAEAREAAAELDYATGMLQHQTRLAAGAGESPPSPGGGGGGGGSFATPTPAAAAAFEAPYSPPPPPPPPPMVIPDIYELLVTSTDPLTDAHFAAARRACENPAGQYKELHAGKLFTLYKDKRKDSAMRCSSSLLASFLHSFLLACFPASLLACFLASLLPCSLSPSLPSCLPSLLPSSRTS